MGKSATKEERFLICAYQITKESEDNQADKYLIGEKANLSPKGVDAITAQLVRGNLLRKRGEVDITVTKTGEEVAKNLMQQFN